jgi:integrase
VPTQAHSLGDFLRRYIDERTDVKPRTRTNLNAAKRRLVEFFKDRPLDSITVADARKFEIWLKSKDYAKATIGRTLKRAKQFFKAAIDEEIGIAKNPFKDIKPPAQVNKSRKEVVTRQMTEGLLAACPDDEWRLIIALARYGGLRIPSELTGLEWANVNWELNRFLVHSPKNEHHEDGGDRWVPIFPELYPYLRTAFEAAPEGATKVIQRPIDGSSNLRTMLLKIIKRAGLKPWQKLFVNMRSSRETELAETFPLHVVCDWIGNTPEVAKAHYLQMLDQYFTTAADPNSAPNSAFLSKAAQNTAQHGPRTERAPNTETPEIPGFSAISHEFPAETGYPQGDSNPCLRRERAMS